MLNRIILFIRQTLKGQSQEQQAPKTKAKKAPLADAMQKDQLETPRQYSGWIFPVRYFSALRYLKHKLTIIQKHKLRRNFPVPTKDYDQELATHLKAEQASSSKTSSTKARIPWLSFPFRAWVFYPLLLLALLFGAWSIKTWWDTQRLEAILTKTLPHYADLQHQNISHHYLGATEIVDFLNESAAQSKQTVLEFFADDRDLQNLFTQVMETLSIPDKDSEELTQQLNRINDAFAERDLPYYIVPNIYQARCHAFINYSIYEFELVQALFDEMDEETKNKDCTTAILITYKIENKEMLKNGDVELPMLYTHRLDQLEVSANLLGATYHKGSDSKALVLTDNIQQYSIDSILPALVLRNRNMTIPYWLQGNFNVEDSVVQTYKSALQAIYPDKAQLTALKQFSHQRLRDRDKMQQARFRQSLMGADTSGGGVLSSGLDALSALASRAEDDEDKKKQEAKKPEPIPAEMRPLQTHLLRSVAYHEAYHLLRNKQNWVVPEWRHDILPETFSEQQKDRVLNELGAYLSEIYYGDKVQRFGITQLLFMGLNRLRRNDAEYYVSRLIFAAYHDLQFGHIPLKPRLVEDDDSLYAIFKRLREYEDKKLSEQAKEIYEALFQRELPKLEEK